MQFLLPPVYSQFPKPTQNMINTEDVILKAPNIFFRWTSRLLLNFAKLFKPLAALGFLKGGKTNVSGQADS